MDITCHPVSRDGIAVFGGVIFRRPGNYVSVVDGVTDRHAPPIISIRQFEGILCIGLRVRLINELLRRGSRYIVVRAVHVDDIPCGGDVCRGSIPDIGVFALIHIGAGDGHVA